MLQPCSSYEGLQALLCRDCHLEKALLDQQKEISQLQNKIADLSHQSHAIISELNRTLGADPRLQEIARRIDEFKELSAKITILGDLASRVVQGLPASPSEERGAVIGVGANMDNPQGTAILQAGEDEERIALEKQALEDIRKTDSSLVRGLWVAVGGGKLLARGDIKMAVAAEAMKKREGDFYLTQLDCDLPVFALDSVSSVPASAGGHFLANDPPSPGRTTSGIFEADAGASLTGVASTQVDQLGLLSYALGIESGQCKQ